MKKKNFCFNILISGVIKYDNTLDDDVFMYYLCCLIKGMKHTEVMDSQKVPKNLVK